MAGKSIDDLHLQIGMSQYNKGGLYDYQKIPTSR